MPFFHSLSSIPHPRPRAREALRFLLPASCFDSLRSRFAHRYLGGLNRLSAGLPARRILLSTFGFLLSALMAVPAARAYEWQNSGIWESALAERGFDSGPNWFSSGPAWMMNALPGSNFRARNYVIDSAGDRQETTTQYDGYVGTLHDVFNVSFFNNVSTFGGGTSGGKSSTPRIADSAAPDLFWRTDGTAGTWTGTNWSNPATATGGTVWTNGDDAFFTANSTVTFATATVSDVTVSASITVTITAGGTLTLGGIRTFDIGAGSTLSWTSQSQSTAASNEGAGIIKNGSGILNLNAGPGTNARYDGGFTLNAGTVIVSGNNALSSGILTLNGGTLQSSGGLTYTSSSIVVGGDFALAGSGNDFLNQSVNLGGATRIITNNATGNRTFGGVISNGGLTFSGTGTTILSGGNNYSGGTTISSGTLQLSGSGTLGSTSGSLTINGGILDVNGTNQTVGSLSGSGGTIKSSTGTPTLTVGNGDGSGSYAGSITNLGTIALTKTGAGTQTLTNNNSYTGATLVTGGTLELKNTSGVALSGTSGVTVNNSGTLLFSANNQINQATLPGITVDNGKLNAGGVSQGTGGTPAVPNSGTVGLGALTMNSSSVIDLTGTSVFHFADSSAKTWTGTLSIWDWNGTATTGGGSEQILFGGTSSGLTAGQLLQVSFYSDGGTTLISNTALILADGEIIPGPMTPIPEASTWIGAALALGAIGFTQRKRFAKRSRV